MLTTNDLYSSNSLRLFNVITFSLTRQWEKRWISTLNVTCVMGVSSAYRRLDALRLDAYAVS